MQHQIHVVGIGSLGSTFCHEMARRLVALETPGQTLCLHDYDTVDKGRNLTAQMFWPEHDGRFKASVVAEQIESLLTIAGCCVVERPLKVTSAHQLFDPFIDGEQITVDMVDHYPTRMLIDSDSHGTPVLHVGMSESGDGFLGWSYQGKSTWNLHPDWLTPEKMIQLFNPETDVKLPPCVLSSLRPLIWNTAYAAVEAVSLFMGRDLYGHIRGEDGQAMECPGIMTSWATSAFRTELLTDLTMFKE